MFRKQLEDWQLCNFSFNNFFMHFFVFWYRFMSFFVFLMLYYIPSKQYKVIMVIVITLTIYLYILRSFSSNFAIFTLIMHVFAYMCTYFCIYLHFQIHRNRLWDLYDGVYMYVCLWASKIFSKQCLFFSLIL